MKNGADRGMVADFLSALQQTERSRQAPPAVTQAVLGCGDRIGGGDNPVFHQHQLLIANADDDASAKAGSGNGVTAGVSWRECRKERQPQGGGTKHPRSNTQKTIVVTR